LQSFFVPRRKELGLAAFFRLSFLSLFAGMCLLAPRSGRAQEALLPAGDNIRTALETTDAANLPSADLSKAGLSEAGLSGVDLSAAPLPAASFPTAEPASGAEGAGGQVSPFKGPVESEVIAEGLASYGNYKIFAAGTRCKLYTAGVEYDRHSWGYLLGSQVDYVAEFLPMVLLREPTKADLYGNPRSHVLKTVPGIGFSPIGVRFQWFSKRAIRPYLEVKGGMLLFDQKAVSPDGSYEQFSLQSAMGVQVKMSQRWGLRLGLFGDFHFSNGFVVPINPGLDVMNSGIGVSYHFGQ
jgi:hypothetical protein